MSGTWSLVGVGAVASGNANNTPIAPTLPSGYQAGDLLLLQSQVYQGSFATPSVANYSQISPGTHAKQIALWARIATNNSSDDASVNWASSGIVYYSGWLTAYRPSSGFEVPPLGSLVHASADALNNNNQTITYSALTITAANCLVLAAGSRDKTSATNSATFGSPSSGSFSARQTSIIGGAALASILNDWIQTTATSLTSAVQSMSAADGSTQQYESIVMALYPPVAAGGAGVPQLMTMGCG